MALTNNDTLSPKYTNDWYSALVFTSDLFSKITVLPNVVAKTKIPNINYASNPLQADGCSWNASGNITINTKEIDPIALKINSTVCKGDLDASFISFQMKQGALNKEIPTDVDAYLMDNMAKQIQNQLEAGFWNSTTGVPGVISQMTGDTGVVKYTATTTLSASNIIAELDKVYGVIPDAVLFGIESPKIYMGTAACKYLKTALATLNRPYNPTYGGALEYMGLEVVPTLMGINTIVVAVPSNLVYACDLISDNNNIQIIDMSKTDGSDEIRFKGRTKMAFSYKTSSEIVLYR